MYTGTDGLLHASNQGESEYLDEQRQILIDEEDKKRLQEARDKVWKFRLGSLTVNNSNPWMCQDSTYGIIDGCGDTIQEAIENCLTAIVKGVDHIDFSTEDINYTWI